MKQKLIYSNVRGCKATTMVPLTIPSPFNRIHRPRRCSCPIPATRRITFDEDAEFRCAMASSPLGWGHAHEVGGKASCGADISWRELTTPGAGTVPMRANDLSFASSFHNRMSPSQEPGSAQPMSGGLRTETNVADQIRRDRNTVSLIWQSPIWASR